MSKTLRLAALGLLASSLLQPTPARADGNVIVYVRNGSLQVIADDFANSIRVSSAGPEEFVVESLDGVTTVNSTLMPFLASGVGRNVKIDLQDGDDVLVAEDMMVIRDLEIQGGKGVDEIDVNDVAVGKNAKIYTGQDDDDVVVSTSTFGGKLTLQTEQGLDSLLVDLVTVTDRLKIATGLDVDEVTLSGGCNFMDTVSITTSSGNDYVTIDDAAFAGKLGVVLGDDNDVISLTDASFQRIVDLNGGDGVDTRIDGGGNTYLVPPILRKIELFL